MKKTVLTATAVLLITAGGSTAAAFAVGADDPATHDRSAVAAGREPGEDQHARNHARHHEAGHHGARHHGPRHHARHRHVEPGDDHGTHVESGDDHGGRHGGHGSDD